MFFNIPDAEPLGLEELLAPVEVANPVNNLINLTNDDLGLHNTEVNDLNAVQQLCECATLDFFDDSADRNINAGEVNSVLRKNVNAGEVNSVLRKNLMIYMHNMSGMRSALSEFRADLGNSPYDVVMVNETWLQSQHLDSEIIPSGWNIYRKDRHKCEGRLDQYGGGVFIAVRNELNSTPILVQIPDDKPFDLSACRIRLDNKILIVICFYIPPAASLEAYMELSDAFVSICENMQGPEVEFLIYGDANLSGVQWIPSEFCDSVFDPVNVKDSQVEFLTKIVSLGLSQLSDFKNNSGNVLDVVFSDITSNLIISEAELTLTGKTSEFHRILTAQFFYNDLTISENSKRTLKYDFDNADFEAINAELLLLPRRDYSHDINVEASNFVSAVFGIMDKHTPKRFTTTLTCAPHMDKALRVLRNKRNNAFRTWNSYRTIDNYTRFRYYSDLFKTSELEAKRMYEVGLVNSIIDEPKRFWSYINDKRGSTTYPATMKLGADSASDSAGIAELFSAHFASKFSSPLEIDEHDFEHIPRHETKLSEIQLSVYRINDVLMNLDVKKGAGNDLIPPIFLRNTASAISAHMCDLFNASLSQAVFPDCFKLANLTPVFKSNDKSNVENYRPISILCSMGKVFEKLVTEDMSRSLHSVLHPSQHGFLAGRSTVTNLVEYTSYIRLQLAKGSNVDAIYTDFSSAFDKVDHRLLIFKLEKYGIRGSLLNWIKSYLENRKQRVKFMGEFSNTVDIESGVPQGSIIGPFLFLVFINDLVLLLPECLISIYADDLKLYKVIGDANDSISLQRSLSKLYEWCKVNGMKLNVKKCAVITFSRKNPRMALFDYKVGDDKLKRVDCIRDLGVLVDSKLTFRDHVIRVANSARVILGFVKRRVKEFSEPYLCRTLYCSLVQPILEYGSIVWAPYRQVDIDKIESVQKQFLLFALRDLGYTGYHLPPYRSRLLLLNMTTLELRREKASATFILDLIQGDIDCKVLADRITFKDSVYNTRDRNILNEERHVLDYAINDPIARGIKNFNKYKACYDRVVNRNTFKERIDRVHRKLH